VNDAPTVSVVVPAHDTAQTIGAQIRALQAQDADRVGEIIVVDNRSTDATAAIVDDVARSDARIRRIAARENAGPSYARNVGIRSATNDAVLCCDADDVVTTGWVRAFSEALVEKPYVGGPLEVDELNEQWLVDGRGRWGSGRPGCFGKLEFAHGCNLGIRKSLFLSVGGFDERLRTGEEIDLAIRLRERGVSLGFVPSAIVHYRFRTGVSDNYRQSFSFARNAPLLERRARSIAGFRRDGGGVKRALWLTRHLGDLGEPSGRIRWTWVAGTLCGRAVGYSRAFRA
jgi:glycosyltransferase involved in cell wall biosynthesis